MTYHRPLEIKYPDCGSADCETMTQNRFNPEEQEKYCLQRQVANLKAALRCVLSDAEKAGCDGPMYCDDYTDYICKTFNLNPEDFEGAVCEAALKAVRGIKR